MDYSLLLGVHFESQASRKQKLKLKKKGKWKGKKGKKGKKKKKEEGEEEEKGKEKEEGGEEGEEKKKKKKKKKRKRKMEEEEEEEEDDDDDFRVGCVFILFYSPFLSIFLCFLSLSSPLLSLLSLPPLTPSPFRKSTYFTQDSCGLRATGENNEPLPEIYFMGIIDILQPYNATKRVENTVKGMFNDRVSGFIFLSQ